MANSHGNPHDDIYLFYFMHVGWLVFINHTQNT